MKPLNETDVHGVSSAHPLLWERAGVRADVPPSHCPLRAKGECTSWIGTRGFGFVEIPGESRPVFVHCREVPVRDGLKTLKPGETVELSYREQRDKRLRATAVFFPIATNADDHSPSPGAPQPAKRESTTGQPSSGGLGKPLGRDEGGLKANPKSSIVNRIS